MVCICCCAAYLERDIDCIGTQYSQMVIEFTGFGPPGSCACPNELGSLVIDLNDTTQDITTFCVAPPPDDSFWTAETAVYGASAAKGQYDPATKSHIFVPGTSAVVVQIFQTYTLGGTTYKDLIYSVTIVTRPAGTECQSCSDFVADINGVVYEVFATSFVFGCNSVSLDWYLQ